MKIRGIEILEKDSNKKGDLFGRLMADLFHSLGYEEPRLNIHKSGREIDLTCQHRAEQKIAIAECKAHAEPIGGADVNKFIGVIDAETRKLKKEKGDVQYNVTGYFISLSGFKETAIEQENEFNNNRVILIGAAKIIDELIKGKIIVSPEKAISKLSTITSAMTLLDYADLLAYNKGWVWAIYYSNTTGQTASHVAFVHAEGQPLISDLSIELLSTDKHHKDLFKNLILLNNSLKHIGHNLNESKTKYYNYLDNELGEIHFEGLPTDKEAGTIKVKLENIFVPIRLKQSESDKRNPDIKPGDDNEGIGDVLTTHSKLALLAKPGGGKSTLLKRIAIAYAFPERRSQINDKLPDRDLFPIFLRCRELGDKVTLSINEIIRSIPNRAEIPECLDNFSILASTALQNGNGLLLIDGLDEIAEDKNRVAFVNQLRTFIATYPSINVIVTSREAGFRVVAGSLAAYCKKYTVSNLNPSEIKELSLKWHKAVIDSSESTIKEANKLSELILKDNRITVLAQNPLLLTTLLFVKRWAGYLPTKKSVLYQEMIKLLLVTWNVEGHEILDIDEAEPQLAYISYWMMKNGRQNITSEELINCLIEARRQMPEILGYTKISPSEFIKRVELRSSLLIMSGHKKLESGNITAIYEFLHLSFQEYLAAKAIVKKFMPLEDIENKITDTLKPHLKNENWKEVIPLAAVLLEREAKNLIEYLIAETQKIALMEKKLRSKKDRLIPFLLGNCLANEVQINPILLDTALEWYAKSTYIIRDKGITEIILNNKFGAAFRKKIKQTFSHENDANQMFPMGSTLGDIFLFDFKHHTATEISQEVISILKNENLLKEEKCTAILGVMSYAFSKSRALIKLFSMPYPKELFEELFKYLTMNDREYDFSIAWAVAWSADAKMFPKELRDVYVVQLANIWTNSKDNDVSRASSWALSKIVAPDISPEKISSIANVNSAVREVFGAPRNEFDKLVAVYLGTIIGEKFDQKIVSELFNQNKNNQTKNYVDFSNLFNIHALEDSDSNETL